MNLTNVASTPSPAPNWLDRAIGFVAPRASLQRARARMAMNNLAGLQRHYEAAAAGRRTSGWRRSSADANGAIGPALGLLRDQARDLVRNNPYAESAISTIADHAVGWGLTAKTKPKNLNVETAWKEWAETTLCDADGVCDFYGLQKLVMRTVVEAGEVLVRRRFRRVDDGFPVPMQIQVLDPDFIDTGKNVVRTAQGGSITQGIERDAIGRRVAYWLFQDHPGGNTGIGLGGSVPVAAQNVRHIFRPTRAGQLRALTWLAPIILRLRDFDEFEDATLMKQKIAACLAVITSDPDGSGSPLGEAGAGTSPEAPEVDQIEPGAILNIRPGRSVEVVQPPQVREYGDYARTQLRAIATGIGVTYEDLTGDYADMPFSAARMSRIRHWARVEDWRWRILIPQMCEPVFGWWLEAALIMNRVTDTESLNVEWTGSPAPLVDPVNEGLAFQRNVRAGIQSLPDAIRERGYDPTDLMQEIQDSNADLDRRGILLDSDPRNMTQAGQLQGKAAAAAKPETAAPPPAAGDGEEEDPDRARALRVWPRR